MDELVKALETIKAHCDERIKNCAYPCLNCPVGSGKGTGGCALTLATPHDWKIDGNPIRIVKI